MNIKCMIVDDEPLAVKVLETHIADISSLSVVATCSNAFAAMDVLKESTVDLIFLDIHMPKLMGHHFLETLRNPPKVIFTTAYKEYALEAFDLDAVDYLLKPITLSRLVKAINKITNAKLAPEREEGSIVENEGFVYFRAERKMIKINYSDIIYIESMKDYIKIIRTFDKPLMVKQSISSLEDVLPANPFLRIHRSFIVSLDKIIAFNHRDVDVNGIEIPIGRLYSKELEKVLKPGRMF